MSEAFVSYVHCVNSNFPFTGLQGRMAALWFDTVWLDADWQLDGVVEMAKDHYSLSKESQAFFGRWLQPTQRVLPPRDYRNPWSDNPHVTEASIKIAKNFSDSMMTDEGPSVSANHRESWEWQVRREAAYIAAHLSSHLDRWMALQTARPMPMLASTIERQAVSLVLEGGRSRSGLDLFTDFLSTELPDISEMPWDDVLTLRNHQAFDSFRKRVRELAAFPPIRGRTHSSIQDALVEDMKAMCRELRPAPCRAFVRGAMGCAPMPWAVSLLLSGGMALQDTKAALEDKRDYNWLYFALDVQDLGRARASLNRMKMS